MNRYAVALAEFGEPIKIVIVRAADPVSALTLHPDFALYWCADTFELPREPEWDAEGVIDELADNECAASVELIPPAELPGE